MAQQAEFTLQIVTNLGTRLLTMAPVSFSVSDAKRKIESDHFGVLGSTMGEIRIHQLMVEHMGQLYCLPDDVTLADAFAGTTSSYYKPLVVEASQLEDDAQVGAGAVNIQGSEANISAGTNAVNATGANEANVVSDGTKKKKKKTIVSDADGTKKKKKTTKKRSQSPAAE